MNAETAKKLLDKTLSDMGYVEPDACSSSRDPMYMSYSYDPKHDSNGMGIYKSASTSDAYRKFPSTPAPKPKKA
jgi:hypothetical protein